MSKNIRWNEDQKEILLDFMSSNPEFAAGRLLGPLGKQKEAELWNRVSNILNASGVGANKTVEKWIRTWSDWKCNAKAKASEIRNFVGRTGGGHKCPKKLNDLEHRLLEFVGWNTVTGLTNIPEAGLGVVEEPEAGPSRAMPTTEEPPHPNVCHLTGDLHGDTVHAEPQLSFGGTDSVYVNCDVNEANGACVIGIGSSPLPESTGTGNESSKRKRSHNADKDKRSTPRPGDNNNPYSSAARSFEKIEERRNKYYEEISNSFKDIATSVRMMADSKKKKVDLLERLVLAKEAKYGIVRPVD